MEVVAAVHVDLPSAVGPTSTHTCPPPDRLRDRVGTGCGQIHGVDRGPERSADADGAQAHHLDRRVRARSTLAVATAVFVAERRRGCSARRRRDGRRGAGSGSPTPAPEAQVGFELDLTVARARRRRRRGRSSTAALSSAASFSTNRGIDRERPSTGLEPFAPHVGGGGAERRQHRRELGDEDPRRPDRGGDARREQRTAPAEAEERVRTRVETDAPRAASAPPSPCPRGRADGCPTRLRRASRPNGAPTRAHASFAASASSPMSPPRNRAGSR